MGEELNSTRKSHLFLEHCETVETGPPSSSLRAVWPLHEKGTISQYSDRNKQQTRYCVEVSQLLEEGVKLEPARYYRLAHRKAIHAQEELKVVFALLPPCVQVADSALPERNPHSYPVCDALWLMAIANSFSVNALARPRVGLNLLKHNRETIPLPAAPTARALLVHHALRLSCNHQGFQDLWDGELRRVWHEPKPLNTWPVLETEDERWAVRAVIDAVVADAYGLNRSQYEHILSTFSHKSYPKAPELCLAAFDELKAIGLEAFTKKHDPYWDIPLNEELPKPVIDLPIPSDSADQVREGTLPLYGASEPEQEDE